MSTKRKSTGGHGTSKKAKTSDRYDERTGRWMSSAPAKRVVSVAVAEKKGMDTDVSLTAGNVLNTTNTNGGAFVLNLVQAGTGSWNRVGRKTHLKSVRVKGLVSHTATPNATTGAMVSNFVRMVLVWDKQPSGAAVPSFDSIFGITAQDGTESCPDVMCPPRYDNMDRFRIIRDKTVDLNIGVVDALGTIRLTQYICNIDEYVKLADLECVYSGQSSPMTIADISTGALYLYFRAYNNASGASECTVDAVSRLRYTD